jgi:hypothetical protein
MRLYGPTVLPFSVNHGDDEAKENEKGDMKPLLLEQGTRRQALYTV